MLLMTFPVNGTAVGFLEQYRMNYDQTGTTLDWLMFLKSDFLTKY
jgi:hypothetical protein